MSETKPPGRTPEGRRRVSRICYDTADNPAEHDCAAIEEELAHIRELLRTLVYWHDRDTGHIDESWWDEARSVAASPKGGESHDY